MDSRGAKNRAADDDNANAGVVSASSRLVMDDETSVAAWCERYGVTRDQLAVATTMVGLMPAALHFYLTSRGRPTKVVTDEMRASRTPIRPRDRRRRDVAEIVVPESTGSPDLALERLRQERSQSETRMQAASDSLHAHPCPSTIRAYDDAQAQFDETSARLDIAQRAADARSPSTNEA